MPKKIILFSDGTGNSAAALFKTNVFRLYQAIDLSSTDQIAFYDDGVGTSSFRPLAMLGGAFGFGLKRNVLDLYIQLSRTFENDDKIYLFGFSRGAFTVRILAGLILRQGLLKKGSDAQMTLDAYKAFRAYRRHFEPRVPGFDQMLAAARWVRDKVLTGWDLMLRQERNDPPKGRTCEVTFLGVWDTVAAYGLPIDELTRAWNAFFPLSVPDRNLHMGVKRACQALALDDERNTFHPVLWNEAGRCNQRDPNAPPPRHIDDERLTQVWFAGMHANVGGGYPQDGLAYVTLDWMMRQVSDQGPLGADGLRFRPNEHDRVRSLTDYDAPMADSRQGLGGSYRYQPRKLALLAHDLFGMRNAGGRTPDVVQIDRIKIHESVMRRIASNVTGYAPIVLPESYAVVAADGSIYDLPSPSASSPPLSCVVEDKAQAVTRAIDQEWVWNLVWFRRVVYFSSIIALLFVMALPLMVPAAETCIGPACFLVPAVSGLGMFLPGFLEPWLATWRSHPATFAVPILMFGALLGFSGVLQTWIGDAMRPRWRGRVAQGDVKLNWLYRLRTAAPYQYCVQYLKRVVTPTIAGVCAFVLIAAGISRVGVAVSSSLGLYCPDLTSEPVRSETAASWVFSTKDVCSPSGILLEKGRRYAITIEITQPWKDASIDADVLGFGIERLRWYARPIVLLRRHIGELWFMPIARIGALGSDEYPLRPNDWSRPGRYRGKMTGEITARRTGPLYLFVNDAILPLNIGQPFYDNNVPGEAKVTVTPLTLPSGSS